jgi:hypothetical protein
MGGLTGKFLQHVVFPLPGETYHLWHPRPRMMDLPFRALKALMASSLHDM